MMQLKDNARFFGSLRRKDHAFGMVDYVLFDILRFDILQFVLRT